MLAFLSLIGSFKEAIGIGKFIGIVIGTTLSATVIPTVVIYNVQSKIPNATVLLTAIHEQAYLDTIQAEYEIHVSAGIISGPNGIYSYSGTYAGDGEITAGIDLSEIEENDIIIERNFLERSIILNMPPPKFTNCVITNFQRTSRSITLFVGANWSTLYNLATVDGYYALTDMGLADNLLNQAEVEAFEVLRDILSSATNIPSENINALYATENRGAGSDSDCEPDFPPGWGKEDVNYAWVRLP